MLDGVTSLYFANKKFIPDLNKFIGQKALIKKGIHCLEGDMSFFKESHRVDDIRRVTSDYVLNILAIGVDKDTTYLCLQSQKQYIQTKKDNGQLVDDYLVWVDFKDAKIVTGGVLRNLLTLVRHAVTSILKGELLYVRQHQIFNF